MSNGSSQLLPPASALLRTLWASAQPATLQDADFRLVDVNDAYAALVGLPREALIGRDPLELQPLDDRDLNRAAREQVARVADTGMLPPVLRRRLIDSAGQEHWFSLAICNIAEAPAPPLWLALLQDLSAEHQARRLARRAEDELAQWFELSGSGMLVYDSTGLIVRSNAAFEALVEQMPEVLDDAPTELQHLLGWHQGATATSLLPGSPPQERQALLTLADGRRRRLWARLACQVSADALQQRHVMAMVQDRSAEDERDLAQLEIGMLMDTASIGVATYDPARGWLVPPRSVPGAAATPAAAAGPGAAAAQGTSSGALLGIGRELVEPDSLPEFERLQRALRGGERTEVRYAVRHPDLGLRWLLTRVEPRSLAGGRKTTSIVTLDVTEQEAAQRRNEQLLRELTTILDSSTAGIAYLRGPALVRCNWRFERMLGFDPGAAAGASLTELLARGLGHEAAAQHALAAQQALAEGRAFEAELTVAGSPTGAARQWVSLSLRGASAEGRPTEAVAVLTDITRLKGQQAELEQLLRDRELMFSLSEVGIVYQRGARIERANQAMAELTGWASPELMTLDAAELYPSARDCVDFEARIASALAEQGRFSGERLLRHRDGRLSWVQVAVRPVHSDAPHEGVICSFVDIDERRRTRETLAAQAERTRAILNSVLVGIVTVSERGIEWMNRSARRMFAGELADFVGEPISLVATPEPEHPLRRSDWLQRLQEGQAETFECRLRGRDGREFWVVGNAVLTGQHNVPAGAAGQGSGATEGLGMGTAVGTAAGVAMVPDSAGFGGRELTFALLDIEKRRQAEVSIAQAQASLQRVMETAPLAIALFDARTLRVQQLNQTAIAFFGAGLPAALGALPHELCPGPQAEALHGWLTAVLAAGSGRQYEWQTDAVVPVPGARADTLAGRRTWDCRITPLHDGSAVSAQLLLVATDVSEQRAAERARLQAAIDQREVLVREVHHRIKNNLQGVAGLLQQNAVRHPEVATVLSEAVGQVQAIAQVYGLQVGASGPLGVAGLLRAIAQSVQRTFGRPITVQVVGEVPHQLPEPEAIPIALTVNELLTNAIKHGQGGEVTCELRALASDVHIRVASVSQLVAGFDLQQVRAGVSGLGLVRALLPRRSATLTLTQQGAEVVALIELRPPSVLGPGLLTDPPQPEAAPAEQTLPGHGPQSAP